MRLIGNKTKLLGEIDDFLTQQGLGDPSEGLSLIDIFSGTSSVGRYFKSKGFRVLANDRLSMCYAQAVAQVEVSAYPPLAAWRKSENRLVSAGEFRERVDTWITAANTAVGPDENGRDERKSELRTNACRPLAEFIYFLNEEIEPREGLIYRSFCPSGPAGRAYFTDENGQRIDGILHYLRCAYRTEVLTKQELYLALAVLIDAADRVANISGTYGAYLKKMQSNTSKPLRLDVPHVVESSLQHKAYRSDANELIRKLKGDVLYVDPPYNHRQYAANYHVLEIIAEYHEIEDLSGYEACLYGKTGLRPYEELKSLYCVRPSRRATQGNVFSVMSDLILSSRATHVLVSYNEEGLLSREELGTILARFAGERAYNFDEQMREVQYRRFRSDADRSDNSEGAKRSYKVLDGRDRDKINEWLLFASRAPRRRRKAGVALGSQSGA